MRAVWRPSASGLSAPLRDQRAGLGVALLSLVVFVFVFEADPAAHRPGADGHYSWLVARSLAFDFDLHYANDYALCGDPWGNGVDRGGGRPDNPFYVGPAVFWTPALWLSRALIRLPASAPPSIVGACVGPRAHFALFAAPILGALSVLLFYRIARRFVDRDGPAALSAALFGLTGSLLAYATVLPSYSHTYATFVVACLVLASLRAHEEPASWKRWALAAFLLALAMLQRSSALVFAVLPLGFALLAARRQQGIRRLIPPLLVGAGLALGAGLVLLYYRLLYGDMLTSPQGPYYAHLGHGHPWLLLFGIQGGLFFTAPVAWLAVIGLGSALRDRESRLVASLVAVICALEIYINSLPNDWDGACTFGARRLTTLLPLFALLAVRPIEWLRAYLVARPERAGLAVGVAAALPVLFGSFGAVWGLPRGQVPLCAGASQEQLYGRGAAVTWSLLDQVGDVAVLPMSLAFRLRYGLPMRAWREATRPRIVRNYRDLTWVARELPATDPGLAGLARGMAFEKEGARITGKRATLVFAAQWPVVTSVTLRITATQAARLEVAHRSWIGTTSSWGGVQIEPGTRDYRLEVPKGGFDSGLSEVVFQLDRPGARVSIARITVDDETPRVPLPRRPPR